MNNFKLTSQLKKIALILAVSFVTYNVVLFAISGFEDHYASFWISYVFALIAFGVVSATVYLLKSRGVEKKDWLLGYPVLRHSAIYVTVELVLSLVFMIIDNFEPSWWISFVPQFITLVVHIVFISSCFMAHDTIVEVQAKVKDATSFIKLLQVDVEMIIEKSSDPEVKKAFTELAEQVRYSDPMSNDNLFELEKQITLQVSNADSCITLNDIESALRCCNRATLLLTERNKKCKALK